MTIVITAPGGRVEVEVIEERFFGWVARAPTTGALFLLTGTTTGHPLLAGPSLLRLLASLPDGILPLETAAAAISLLAAASEPRPLTALRFDVDTDTWRWEARAYQPGSRARDEWVATLGRRLFGDDHGGIRPRVEHLFDPSRDRLSLPSFGDLDAGTVAGGLRHLGELTRVVLRDEVVKAELAVEEWRLLPATGQRPQPDVESLRRKAWDLRAQAEAEGIAGRRGAARMNARLATLYAGHRLVNGGRDPGLDRFLQLVDARDPDDE
jgi:hypothetical protein